MPQMPINLPELKLAEFSGNIREWPSFWSTFQYAIDQQPLPEMAKLTYLLSVLKGEAFKLVASFPVREQNYRIIVQTLQAKYNQSGLLRSLLYSELQQIHPATRVQDLGSVWQRIDSVLRQLETLGDDTNGPQIATMIEAKLPFFLLQKVCQLKMSDPWWTVDKLRKFITETVQVRDHAIVISQSTGK